jgi:hypothetical protein
MKKGKLDFLLNVADNVRADVNQSNAEAVNKSTPQPSSTPVPPEPPTPSEPPTLSEPPVPPVPALQKQKREEKKIITNSIDRFFDKKPQNIETVGISITKETQENLGQVVAEINTGMCHVRIHPEHDMQLSIMAKKLRYKHGLRGRGGISKMALIYLILENALKAEQ